MTIHCSLNLQAQYMKIPSSNLGRTFCIQKLFLTFRTIFVHNMFSLCSAKRRASDKDLLVLKKSTIDSFLLQTNNSMTLIRNFDKGWFMYQWHHVPCRVVQWSVGGDSSTRYVHLTFSLFHFIPPFITLFIIYIFCYICHKFQVNLPKMMFVLSNYADICNKIHILMLFSLLQVRKVISFLAFLKKIQIFGGKTKEVTL